MGGLWLKINRPTLPRQINTHPMYFVMGLLLVAIAFTAVVLLHPDVLTYFYIYYGLTVLVVMMTFVRVAIFTTLLKLFGHSKVASFILKNFVNKKVAQKWIVSKLQKLRNQGVVYFSKHANMNQINRALQYIEENEEARW